MDPIRKDAGYALVAAVTAVAALAYVAFQVLAADQGGVAIVRGRTQQAQLSAAADAGLYLAIHGLAIDDPADRWAIDGSAPSIITAKRHSPAGASAGTFTSKR